MPKKRERKFDWLGPITKMAEADGYVMWRRPRCIPGVMTRKKWDALSSVPVTAGTDRVEDDAQEERESFIYFIASGDSVKIGYTASPFSRVIKMTTDNAGKLEILHVERGTFKQEKIFHRHFAEIRIRGEWFQKTPELLAFVEQRKRIAAGEA